MSKIEALIQKLCPDGVPSVKLGEVCKIMNGKDYKHLAKGDIPVYGSGGIMTHVDEFAYNKPSVLIPRKGSIGNLFYTDKPFWTVDTLYWTKIDEKLIAPKFFYYLMTTKDLGKLNMAAGVPSLTQSMLYKIAFPLPPLPVQEEVVRILDKFSALEAELEAELEARKKQYEHYRNHLLNFNDNPNVKWLKLGEVCKRNKGIQITAAQMRELNKKGAPIRIFAAGNTKADVEYADVNAKAIITEPSVIVKSRGNIGFEYYDKPFSHKSEMWSYTSRDCAVLNIKFLFYYFSSLTELFQRKARANSVKLPQLSTGDTDNFVIPLPPLAEQERIVGILDRFEALTTSLQEGLPAEIAARRKQYEHYRDRLLSFGVKD